VKTCHFPVIANGQATTEGIHHELTFEAPRFMPAWRRMTDANGWAGQIHDQRSRRVIFLAHCLLNENVRYLGGARRGGAVSEILQPCLEHGIGIVQLSCPEQHAWGGVLKRRLLLFYGSERMLRHRLRSVLLPLMLWYTKRIYRKLAKQAAGQIQDYDKAGFSVLGVIGVDASPSCGIRRSLRMREALESVGHLASDTATTFFGKANPLKTAGGKIIDAGCDCAIDGQQWNIKFDDYSHIYFESLRRMVCNSVRCLRLVDILSADKTAGHRFEKSAGGWAEK